MLLSKIWMTLVSGGGDGDDVVPERLNTQEVTG